MKFVNSLDAIGLRCQLLDAFDDVLRSGQYAEGKKTDEAEDELSRFLGRRSLTLNSCGSALYAVFRYYRKAGVRAVLMQNNTFWATAAMAKQAGLKVILVDSRPDCPSMSVESLDWALRTSENMVGGGLMVCLTHIGGWVAKDYDQIVRLCAHAGLPLVEDCAHAFATPGFEPDPSTTQCWSFYPTKAVPVGDAGAVSSHNVRLMSFVDKFRKYGKSLYGGVMQYEEGMNLRISEFNAVVLTLQIKRAHEIVAGRAASAASLQSIAPSVMKGPTNWYKYIVRKKHAEGLMTTSPVYCLTDQIAHIDPSAARPVELENSFRWAREHTCLPVGEDLYAGMTPERIRTQLRKVS